MLQRVHLQLLFHMVDIFKFEVYIMFWDLAVERKHLKMLCLETVCERLVFLLSNYG